MESTTLPRLVPPGPPPTFGSLVYTYVKYGNRKYLERLLQIWSPAIDDDHTLMGSALHRAILKGDETAVRMVLDAGVSPRVVVSHEPPNYTPLLIAAEADQREIARLLWQLVGPDGRSQPRSSNCLSVAAGKGHADLVADFLEMWDGWPMDEKRQALNTAAGEWHDMVVGVLLAKVPYEADAIQHALEVGATDSPILPVARIPSRVPITTAEDNLRQQRVVCQLIEAGANPDILLFNRTTPILHIAANSRHLIGALRGLLEKGANATIQDQTGKTALHRLFERSHSSMDALRLLLQHGASPEVADKAGETGLHAAAHMGTLEQLQLCLASCRDAEDALRLRTSHDESLLHYAAAGGREDNVEFLLSHGLDVNAANANGWTPLICALTRTNVKPSYPHCSIASLLLQHGASAQAVTHEGWTALHGLASYPSGNRRPPLENWDGVAPLARELIARGAPLDTGPRLLRGRAGELAATPAALASKSAWGIRIRRFLQRRLPVGTPDIADDPDTMPQMWAHRNGAVEVFNAILEHSIEAAREAES
ncbi:ankyrin [Achaetomium macrosporum]|uniref:Ankyrin n=1 Tax=Achaetomium macrosporum TaxID=79813 RepID=A0AAN7CKI8_9PEZI|nr:ankyrin [Achaetomium macrosporum]